MIVVGANVVPVDATVQRGKSKKQKAVFEDVANGGSAGPADIRPGEHPIVPIMLYDATLAQEMATLLLDLGIYVIGFSYPVVPKGQARIRVQISAAHELEHLDRAVSAFIEVAQSLDVLK